MVIYSFLAFSFNFQKSSLLAWTEATINSNADCTNKLVDYNNDGDFNSDFNNSNTDEETETKAHLEGMTFNEEIISNHALYKIAFYSTQEKPYYFPILFERPPKIRLS